MQKKGEEASMISFQTVKVSIMLEALLSHTEKYEIINCFLLKRIPDQNLTLRVHTVQNNPDQEKRNLSVKKNFSI